MFTSNFSRAAVCGHLTRFGEEIGEKDWLISISDKNFFPAPVAYNFEKILFMDFHDTIVADDGLTDEDARMMAEFIKEAKEKKKNLWVNCHMGVSRSGAVVELLSQLGWTVREDLRSNDRVPNVLVFNKLAEHFPEITYDFKKRIVGLNRSFYESPFA